METYFQLAMVQFSRFCYLLSALPGDMSRYFVLFQHIRKTQLDSIDSSDSKNAKKCCVYFTRTSLFLLLPDCTKRRARFSGFSSICMCRYHHLSNNSKFISNFNSNLRFPSCETVRYHAVHSSGIPTYPFNSQAVFRRPWLSVVSVTVGPRVCSLIHQITSRPSS